MPLRISAITLHRPDFFPAKLQWFSGMVTLFRFAEALLLITGPVAIYRWNNIIPGINSLPVSEFEKGMIAVVGFYLFSRIFHLLFLEIFAKVLAKIGVSYSLIIGLFLHMVCYFAFSLVPNMPWVFFLLPFLRSLSLLFYWLGYHLFFSSEADLSKLGREIGAQEFVGRVATLLAPFLGAIIAVATSFSVVFLAAGVFYVLAGLCALKLPNRKTRQIWSWNIFRTFLNKDAGAVRLSLSVVGLTWETTGIGLFWPLFLTLELNSMRSAAYVLSAASFLALVLTYLSGWIFDHRKRSTLIARSTGLLLSFLWLPRLLFSHIPMALVMTDSADRILGGMYGTFFQAGYIWQARHGSIFQAYFHYEAIVTISLIVGYVFTLLALFILPGWNILFVSFFLAGLLSLLFRFSKVLPQEKQ
jgi:hypothetical protein